MAEPPDHDASVSDARLAALRDRGAEHRDPVRFAYLRGLVRRAAKQPEPIRRLLAPRIAHAAEQLAARCQLPADAPAEPSAAGSGQLAELLAYIGQHDGTPPGTNPSPPAGDETSGPARSTRHKPAPELKSVAYFRHTWSKLSTEQQLTQTLAQAPANAGPLNSQHLVLRALQTMRDCAPDYLQGFMSYVDALIWLDHVAPVKANAERAPGAEGEKKARATKRKPAKR